jgi:hypothetical protein
MDNLPHVASRSAAAGKEFAGSGICCDEAQDPIQVSAAAGCPPTPELMATASMAVQSTTHDNRR